jgi:hypothetical protein
MKKLSKMIKHIREIFSRKSNNTNELGVVYPNLPPTYTSTCQITAVTMNEINTPYFIPPTNYFNYSGLTHIGVTHSGVSNYDDVLIDTKQFIQKKKMFNNKEEIFLKKLEDIKKNK